MKVPRPETVERRQKVEEYLAKGLSVTEVAGILAVSRKLVYEDKALLARPARTVGRGTGVQHRKRTDTPKRLAPDSIRGTPPPPAPAQYFPPERFAGDFRRLLPTVLAKRPVHAMIVNLPAERATPTLMARLHSFQAVLKASHNVTKVEILRDADSGVVAEIIERLTAPGDTIVCPVIANGSVMFSAYHLGRRCVVVGEYEAEVATGKLMGGR